MSTLEFPELKEVGNLAAWSVSSFKTGCGVENLCDNNLNTVWQLSIIKKKKKKKKTP